MSATPRKATRFETEPCTRCGGSGSYSYCQMYGTTCFKCSGRGRSLTKRGHAAVAFLRQLRSRKGADVRLGDCILIEGFAGSRTTYARIDTIFTRLRSGSHVDPAAGTTVYYNHLCLEGKTPKGDAIGIHTFPDADVVLVFTKAENEAQVLQALAYEATLTKAGTVAKRQPQEQP